MLHHVGWIGLAAVAVTVSVWREDTAGAVTVVSFPSYCSLFWLQPFFSSFLLAIAAAYTAVVDGDIASSVRDCLLLLLFVRGVCGMGCGHCSLCRTDLLRLLCGECVARGVSTALSVALIFFDRMPSGADRHQHGGMITSAQTPCGLHQ